MQQSNALMDNGWGDVIILDYDDDGVGGGGW